VSEVDERADHEPERGQAGGGRGVADDDPGRREIRHGGDGANVMVLASGRLIRNPRRPSLRAPGSGGTSIVEPLRHNGLDEEDRPRGVAYIARVAMWDMVRKIAENPDELLGMEWLDLERALFEALHGLRYSVRRTRSTKDGGYDLEVEIEGRRYLVEVKRWSAPPMRASGGKQSFRCAKFG